MAKGRQRDGILEHWDLRRKALAESRKEGETRAWIEHGRYRVSIIDDEDFASKAVQLGGIKKVTSGGAWSFPIYARPLVEELIHNTVGRGSIIFGRPPTTLEVRRAQLIQTNENYRGDDRDYYVNLIYRLLLTGDYEKVRETLVGIATWVLRNGMITPNQKQAIDRCMVWRLKHLAKGDD